MPSELQGEGRNRGKQASLENQGTSVITGFIGNASYATGYFAQTVLPMLVGMLSIEIKQG